MLEWLKIESFIYQQWVNLSFWSFSTLLSLKICSAVKMRSFFKKLISYFYLTCISCKYSREGSSEKNIHSNFIVLSILKCKMGHFKPNFMNLVPGVFEIYGIHNLCYRNGVFTINEWFYYINRVYRISNTPGTKFTKLGLKYSYLHFKKNKTIKFEPTWDWLEPSLEALQRIHVNLSFSRFSW